MKSIEEKRKKYKTKKREEKFYTMRERYFSFSIITNKEMDRRTSRLIRNGCNEFYDGKN